MRVKPAGTGYAAALTAVLIAIMTIGGELSAPLKALFVTIGGHHWVGKGIVALIFFVIVAFAAGGAGTGREKRTAVVVVATTILMGLVIFGFFAFEFLAG